MDPQYIDLYDSETDDILTRINIFKFNNIIINNSKKHLNLLKLALNDENFMDSLILINLNWEYPFGLIKELIYWLLVICNLVDCIINSNSDTTINNNNNNNNWSKQKVVIEEAKEKCNYNINKYKVQMFINEYNNLNSSKTEETLKINLGIPILIVVNKVK